MTIPSVSPQMNLETVLSIVNLSAKQANMSLLLLAHFISHIQLDRLRAIEKRNLPIDPVCRVGSATSSGGRLSCLRRCYCRASTLNLSRYTIFRWWCCHFRALCRHHWFRAVGRRWRFDLSGLWFISDSGLYIIDYLMVVMSLFGFYWWESRRRPVCYCHSCKWRCCSGWVFWVESLRLLLLAARWGRWVGRWTWRWARCWWAYWVCRFLIMFSNQFQWAYLVILTLMMFLIRSKSYKIVL